MLRTLVCHSGQRRVRSIEGRVELGHDLLTHTEIPAAPPLMQRLSKSLYVNAMPPNARTADVLWTQALVENRVSAQGRPAPGMGRRVVTVCRLQPLGRADAPSVHRVVPRPSEAHEAQTLALPPDLRKPVEGLVLLRLDDLHFHKLADLQRQSGHSLGVSPGEWLVGAQREMQLCSRRQTRSLPPSRVHSLPLHPPSSS